jgi:hypothetical protein
MKRKNNAQVDAADTNPSETPELPKKQPSQKEFWDAQRATPGFDMEKLCASMPRIVPVSYPKKRR